MIRLLDILFSALGLVLGLPLLVVLLILGFFDTGSPIFRQVRVGHYQQPFIILKFRTMRLGTPSMASHLVDASVTTAYGRFLRRTKLDELPQLWNVLCGDMSLVGPRPCLFNQQDVIAEREALGLFAVPPGMTGLAQLSDIDMSEPKLLVMTEAKMLADLNLSSYLRYLVLTLAGHGTGDRIKVR